MLDLDCLTEQELRQSNHRGGMWTGYKVAQGSSATCRRAQFGDAGSATILPRRYVPGMAVFNGDVLVLG